MCNCINNLEKRMLGIQFKNKKVVKAQFISGLLLFSTGKLQSSSQIELDIEGQKKKGIQNIIHTYCPFCGKKYPKIKK